MTIVSANDATILFPKEVLKCHLLFHVFLWKFPFIGNLWNPIIHPLALLPTGARNKPGKKKSPRSNLRHRENITAATGSLKTLTAQGLTFYTV